MQGKGYMIIGVSTLKTTHCFPVKKGQCSRTCHSTKTGNTAKVCYPHQCQNGRCPWKHPLWKSSCPSPGVQENAVEVHGMWKKMCCFKPHQVLGTERQWMALGAPTLKKAQEKWTVFALPAM